MGGLPGHDLTDHEIAQELAIVDADLDDGDISAVNVAPAGRLRVATRTARLAFVAFDSSSVTPVEAL